MRRRNLIAAFGAVTVLSACATLGLRGFKQPVVSFKDLRVAAAGLTGGSLDVYLNVYNPNGFRLDGTGLTYKLLAGDQQVGSGALNSRFTVQNGDSTTVRIPIDFTYAGLGAIWDQMKNTGSVNYRVLGDLSVGTPVGSFTIPYDQTGRFSPLTGVTR